MTHFSCAGNQKKGREKGFAPAIFCGVFSRKMIVSAALIFLISGALQLTPATAEDVRVATVFDKRSAEVGEEIHLTVRITGAQGNIQAPRLPAFKAFDTFYTGRASHISFINGQSSSNIEFSYALVPKSPGRFRIDPIDIVVNGQHFSSEPVDIEVTGSGQKAPKQSYTSQNAPFNPNAVPSRMPPSNAVPSSASGSQSAPPQPQGSAPAFVPGDDNIFVRAWADKTSVYPNEQVLLTYSLYTRYDTRYEGFDKEPQVSGFWIEEFPMDRDVRRETVTLNGKRYVKADIRLMGLFPTTPADYTIDPGVLKASIRQEPENSSVFDEFFNDSFFSGGGFFGRRENRLLKPAPIQVNVKPFPDKGKPESFQGAVGNFQMNATLDKTSVKQNEPVTLKLVIEGEGNIETLNKPKMPELKEFKVYDADASTQLLKNGNVIGGRKTFEIVFIPLKSGVQKIPKLEFSYFNPARAAYAVLTTPEFSLSVTPSDTQFQLPKGLAGSSDDLKKEVTVEGSDIRYIWEKPPQDTKEFYGPLLLSGFCGGNVLFAVLVLAGMLRRRQEKVFASDLALKRRKLARLNAEKSMRKLGKKKSEYVEDAEKILTRYLSDKFNLSAHGMTRFELDEQLRDVLGDEDPLLKDIRHFFESCDESRFGKGELPAELKQKVLKILQDAIARVERTRRS